VADTAAAASACEVVQAAPRIAAAVNTTASAAGARTAGAAHLEDHVDICAGV
jgi:hypothetical protein